MTIMNSGGDYWRDSEDLERQQPKLCPREEDGQLCHYEFIGKIPPGVSERGGRMTTPD